MTKRKRLRPVVWSHIQVSLPEREAMFDIMSSIQLSKGIRFKSWGDFLTQATQLMLGTTTSNMVRLKGANRYVFWADCPKCKRRNVLHMKSKDLIKMVDCDCGKSFIVCRSWVMPSG